MAGLERIGNWQASLDTLLQSYEDCDRLLGFKAAQTDVDRVRFVYENKLISGIDWLKDYFTGQCQVFHSKDAEKAAHYKQEGNKLFLAGKDEQALQAYTQSMLFAPCSLEHGEKEADLALAYGNRSAVLFRLHRYQDCLMDIERAFAAGFPPQSHHKLLMRRCLCHCRLGQKEQAEAAHRCLVNLMENCDPLVEKHVKNESTKLTEEMKSLKDTSAQQNSSPDMLKYPDPTISYGTNCVLVQASSAVEMKTSAAQGRFLQAKQAIKAGDTLIVERPFVAVLLPPHYGTHCQHCFGRLPDNPVGCCQCSGVLYCNETCREASWESCHHVECRYMDLLHSVGIAHLSLRIVLTVGLKGLIDFLDERMQAEGGGLESVPGVTKEGRYERNYLSVYDLMTHSTDMTTEDLFQYSLTATLLLSILLHGGWFDPRQKKQCPTDFKAENSRWLSFFQGDLTDQEAGDIDLTQVFSVGSVLLRHIQQLVCNAHAITALHSTQVGQDNLVETQSQVRVATAIYPTASLMNHSCNPTIISSFQKDVLIVKSVKDVPAGGEIFNCYGPHYKRMRKEQRREELKTQYFFDCRCGACLNDEQNETTTEQQILCPKCGQPIPVQLKCQCCHETVDIETIMSELECADAHFNEGLKYLEKGDHRKALAKFKKCLKIRCKVMSSNNHDLGHVHDAVAQCLAGTGQYKEAAEHLTRSLAVTENVFGTGSIETARELHKTAEVFIHAGRPKDALDLSARALDIARKTHSEGDHWVQELLCLNTALTTITTQQSGVQ